MAGIAQLKARVEGALERISQQTEARDVFDQKLLALIDVMERGLTRKQALVEEQQAALAAFKAEQAEASSKQEELRREKAQLEARTTALEAEVAELKSGAAERESETAELAALLETLLTALDQQGESRLLEALEELGRRADDLTGNAEPERQPDLPPALPEATEAPEALTADQAEAPCSPEMAAVIEGFDRRLDEPEAAVAKAEFDEDEAAGAEVIAQAEARAEDDVAIIAEASDADIADNAEEAPASVAENPDPMDEALEIASELAEPSELPSPILAEAEAPAEPSEAEPEEAPAPKQTAPKSTGGELSLEAIGELLKEKDSASRPAGESGPESVRTIIERVNALADEMAEPSGEAIALSEDLAGPTEEEKSEAETAESEAPPKAATGG